ncbi:MAG: hypothetical protein EBV44_06670 [Synechococcaceae bacterium WB7_1B_046]|nr:hypothetical protein [Synechococcaceae bacterium WB7_1B_046]
MSRLQSRGSEIDSAEIEPPEIEPPEIDPLESDLPESDPPEPDSETVLSASLESRSFTRTGSGQLGAEKPGGHRQSCPGPQLGKLSLNSTDCVSDSTAGEGA